MIIIKNGPRTQCAATPIFDKLLCDLLEIVYDVSNSCERTDFLFLDLDLECILAEHYKVSKLDRVDSEVSGKLSIKSDVRFVDLKLVNETSLYFFKPYKLLAWYNI